MTDLEILLKIAEDSLRKTGKVPEGFADLLAKVQLRESDPPKQPKGKRKAEPTEPKPKAVVDWTKEIHTCPQCDRSGPVDSMFGVKLVRGVVRRQSWCAKCRSETNYHSRDRKNQTKNNP